MSRLIKIILIYRTKTAIQSKRIEIMVWKFNVLHLLAFIRPFNLAFRIPKGSENGRFQWIKCLHGGGLHRLTELIRLGENILQISSCVTCRKINYFLYASRKQNICLKRAFYYSSMVIFEVGICSDNEQSQLFRSKQLYTLADINCMFAILMRLFNCCSLCYFLFHFVTFQLVSNIDMN